MKLLEIPTRLTEALYMPLEELAAIINGQSVRLTRSETKLLDIIYRNRLNVDLDNDIDENNNDDSEMIVDNPMEDQQNDDKAIKPEAADNHESDIKQEPADEYEYHASSNSQNTEEPDIKTEPMDDGYAF